MRSWRRPSDAVPARSLTPHIVVPEASAAADWYATAFGAEERSRVPLPGGGVMTIELAIGDSSLHVASEFPDAGILSPVSIGGTATVWNIAQHLRDVTAEEIAEGAAKAFGGG